MIRISFVALAVLLLLLADRSFAGACQSGIATGADPPGVTRLRSYAWTFHAPARLALTGDSSLFVTDPERRRVVMRDVAGRIVASRTFEGRPVSIAVDASGRILIGDGDLGRVRAYSRKWEFLYDLGIGAGEFEFPGAIAVTPGGMIYVVDSETHQVRVYHPGGSPNFSFGGPGDGAGLFSFPAGIFVDSAAGEVYVVDQLNFQVQVFDLQGSYLRCIGGTDASAGSFFGRSRPLNQPQGVWVDGAGRVLVSDAADGQVKVFDRNGNALATIGEFGSFAGGLRIPMDLVVDADKRLFVASANNARLEVFGLDDYEDPESVAPAVLRVEPAVLDRDALVSEVEIALELPDYRIDTIQTETLTVNGLAPRSIVFDDADRDLRPDLLARFDAAALAQTLPQTGTGRLAASALLSNGFAVEAETSIEVLSGVTDADGDGVDDPFDLCPESEAGPTDADGCSVAQLCPCEGRDGEAWRNHGHYVVCVIRAAFKVGRHNDLGPAGLRGLVPSAARSACGRPEPRQTRWKRGRR